MTPPEVSPGRKALAAVVLTVALFAAAVIQLTVVNRLPLPGASAPDLVLLLVTAIAVATGTALGAVGGFAGGLALDVAPPAAHYAGEYALVFCLAGYAAARLTRAITDATGTRDPVTAFTIIAVAAAAGEAGKAALGLLVSEPDVTSAAVSRVLPGAILYDLLLTPLAFWLVARVTRGAVAASAPAPAFSRAQRLASVFRQASAGAAPNLRLAGTGADYKNHSPARRLPNLHLSGTSSPAPSRTGSAFSGGSPFPVAGGRTQKLNFAGDLTVGTGKRTQRFPGKNWLRGATTLSVAGSSVTGSSGARGARRAVLAPGKNWLRTGAASSVAGSPSLRSPSLRSPSLRSPSLRSPSLGASAFRSSARLPAMRAPRTPGQGWLRSAGAGGLAGSPGAARPARSATEALSARSAPSGLSALSGPGTPLARRSSLARRGPQAGWLRSSGSAMPSWTAAAGQRLAPRRGWLGAGRRRTVIGRTVTGRKVHGRTMYGRAVRNRHRGGHAARLLRLVGVGR